MTDPHTARSRGKGMVRGSHRAPPTNAFGPDNPPPPQIGARPAGHYADLARARDALWKAAKMAATPEDVVAVLNALRDEALKGNVAAASVWLERILGKEAQPIIDAHGDRAYTMLSEWLAEQMSLRNSRVVADVEARPGVEGT